MSTPSVPNDAPASSTTAPSTCQGQHLICELYGARHLADVEHVTEALKRAARRCGATILEARLHPFDENGGVTGVLLLAESHITIHTWPEHGYAAVDLFMCGTCDPADGLPALRDAFAPNTVQQEILERGRPPSSD